MQPNEAKKAPPTPKDIPTVRGKKAVSVAAADPTPAAQSAAAPVAPAGPPAQYAVIVPPGAGNPQGALILSPGTPGSVMLPGAAVPQAAAAAPTAVPTETPAPKKSKKEKKPKPKKEKKEKEPVIKRKEKKQKTKKPQAPVNPEKSPSTFTVTVPEYMRINQSPVTHGNGVPHGFISSPGTTSVYSGASPASSASAPSLYPNLSSYSNPLGSYASIPSISTTAPAAYAPGYEPAPAYEFFTSIPGN